MKIPMMRCVRKAHIIVVILFSTAFIVYRKVIFETSHYKDLIDETKIPTNPKDWITTIVTETLKETQNPIKNFPENRQQLYENRSRTVMHGCAMLNRSIPKTLTYTNTLVDKIHQIYYCPIPKVGSTFWKRTLTVFSSNGHLKSPYEIRLSGTKLSSWKTVSDDLRDSMAKDWESFLFVRDPYARLFSGYENKIYQPNLGFWKSVGSEIVKTVRKIYDEPNLKYGFDVTFPEFITYIIYQHEHDKSINGHFSAMNKMCDPCQTRFKYIGHLETFTDDAEYLLSKWRRQFKDINLKFDDFYKEAAIDTARSHVRFLFETKEILGTIQFPFIKLMLRTWRDLQIRGYISKYSGFPYEGDVSHVTQNEFLNEIAGALAQPQNRSAVKLQRNEALIQAYRQVSLEDMEKLRQFVLSDCILFGYDDRPKVLFDRTQSLNNDFLYLDGMN